jgi:hypothetical protein
VHSRMRTTASPAAASQLATGLRLRGFACDCFNVSSHVSSPLSRHPRRLVSSRMAGLLARTSCAAPSRFQWIGRTLPLTVARRWYLAPKWIDSTTSHLIHTPAGLTAMNHSSVVSAVRWHWSRPLRRLLPLLTQHAITLSLRRGYLESKTGSKTAIYCG